MDQDLASPAAAPTGWKQLGSTDIIFLGSKIIADGDCNHEIKKMLSPWKRSYSLEKTLMLGGIGGRRRRG